MGEEQTHRKILLVEDEDALREVLRLAIESKTKYQVVVCSTGNEAIDAIKNSPDLTLILCDYVMPDGTGGDVFNYLRSQNSKIPFILMSASPPKNYPEFYDQKISGHLAKPFQVSSLIEVIERSGIPPQGPNIGPPAEFSRISVLALVKFGVLQADLYLKLSEGKFVKVLQKGDYFTADDVLSYYAKNIEFLYLQQQDCGNFIDRFSQDLARAAMAKAVGLESVLSLTTYSLDFVHDIINTMGLTKEAKAVIESSVTLAVRTVTQSPILLEYIEKMTILNGAYIASHSVLSAYLSCTIASLMNWTSEGTFYKLALASFLHDLTLTNERIAKIRSRDELVLNQGFFSVDEIRQYVEHPERAAKLVNEIKGLPPDVGTIIYQHHEKPDGTGFPQALQSFQFHPLTNIFLIAHDFADFILDHHERSTGIGMPDIGLFVKTERTTYTGSVFAKILDSILVGAEPKG